eukprot:scaffold225_cov267-Pavlova_lutheri.AAC.2
MPYYFRNPDEETCQIEIVDGLDPDTPPGTMPSQDLTMDDLPFLHGSKVAFKTVHGTYVQAKSDGTVEQSSSIGSDGKFTLLNSARNIDTRFVLATRHDTFLHTTPEDGTTFLEHDTPVSPTDLLIEFRIRRAPNENRVYIVDYSGFYYLCVPSADSGVEMVEYRGSNPDEDTCQIEIVEAPDSETPPGTPPNPNGDDNDDGKFPWLWVGIGGGAFLLLRSKEGSKEKGANEKSGCGIDDKVGPACRSEPRRENPPLERFPRGVLDLGSRTHALENAVDVAKPACESKALCGWYGGIFPFFLVQEKKRNEHGT